MVKLTFTVESQDERRTVEGEIQNDNGTIVVSEQELSRPDWRVNPDRTVDMDSKKADAVVEEFGVEASMSGYCLRHDVHVEAMTGWDVCPHCRREDRREAERMEHLSRYAPRSVDDPAPIESYRR